MAEKQDYYAVLGVSKTASKEEINKAYKALAFKCHPDRLGSKSEAERKEAAAILAFATEAKTVLVDDDKRKVYDVSGHDGLARAASGHSGSSATDVASPVRVRVALSDDDIFDRFDKAAERRKTDAPKSAELQISGEERRRNAAEERARLRKERISTMTTSQPSSPAPATPREDFRETAAKVAEVSEALAQGGPMVSIPLTVLIKLRESLENVLDVVDNAIAVSTKASGPKPSR